MKQFKRMLAVLSAAVTGALALNVMPAGAAEKSLVVLGDSISAGYGLAEGVSGYDACLGDVLGAKVSNYAVSGYTTADLLTLVQNDKTVRDAVKSADYVCISIGGNDLLGPARAYIETLQQPGESAFDALKRLAKTGNVTDHIAALTRELREPRKEAVSNIEQIVAELRKLNAKSPLVMQTLYNPLEVSPRLYAQYSASDISNYKQFLDYISGTLNIVNRAMEKMTEIQLADVKGAFDGTTWLYVNSEGSDIHPTQLGHALIGAVVLDTLGVKSGKSEGITDGMDSLLRMDEADFPADDKALMERYAAPSTWLFGDTDRNGRVTSGDSLAILKVAVNDIAGLEASDQLTVGTFRNSDVDGNGRVTASDSLAVLKYAVYQITQTPVTWYELTHNPNAPK